MKKLTREWIKKAEGDFVAANVLMRGKQRTYDQICFHCQQSAEKYLKALLQELALIVPRTHNLEDLRSLLAPHFPSLRSFRRGLIFLTDFAVDTRYPMDDASKRDAAAALRWAERVRDACRDLLGFQTRHKAP